MYALFQSKYSNESRYLLNLIDVSTLSEKFDRVEYTTSSANCKLSICLADYKLRVFIVASRDISAGDILYVDQPYGRYSPQYFQNIN